MEKQGQEQENIDKMVYFYRRQNKNSLIEPHHCTKILGVIVFFTIFSLFFMSFTSALWTSVDFEADTQKKQELKSATDFGTYKVIDHKWYDVLKLWTEEIVVEKTLEFNTDICLVDCEASGTTTLYRDEKLFDELEFVDREGKNRDIDYKILIKTIEEYEVEVPDTYVEVCVEIESNNTGIIGESKEKETNNTYCYDEVDTWKNETRYRDVWVEYNYGYLTAGTYEWKIQGKKDKNVAVDWIPTTRGVKMDKWAWWDGDWEYKREISNLTTSYAYSLIYLPISVNMESDFADLRFLNENEDEEIPFWIENYNATDLEIRVKNNYTDTIFAYYGNNVASSVSQLTNLYSSNLVDYWTFNNNNDTSRHLAVDTSATGSGYSLYESGGALFNGGYANFTGITNAENYIQYGYMDEWNYFTSDGSWTILMWAKKEGGDTLYDVFRKSDSAPQIISYVNNNDWNTFIYNTAGSPSSAQILGAFSFEAQMTSGNWNQIVFQQINSTFSQFYHNGVNIHNKTHDSIIPQNMTSSKVITFGEKFNDKKFGGQIDEIGFFSKILSAQEVSDLYNQGISYVTLSAEESYFQEGTININLHSPANNLFTNNNTIFFNATLYPNNVNITNITINAGDWSNYTEYDYEKNNITLTWLNDFDDGEYSWNVTGCYTALDETDTEFGNCTTSDTRTFTIDTIKPNIIANLTQSIIYNYGDNVTLNYAISDVNLDSCWYNYNNTNTSLDCNENVFNITSMQSYTDIIVYANDTAGNQNNSEVLSFTYDTIPPQINISYPTAEIAYGYVGQVIDLNFTATDDNLDSCWYDYNDTITYVSCSSGILNEENITLTSQSNITVYANDTLGNENSSFLAWDYNLFENEITANATDVIWTGIQSEHSLFLDIEGMDDYFVTTKFWWEGTNYGAGSRTILESDKYIYNKNFEVGFIGEEREVNWTWEFEIKDGTEILHAGNVTGTQNYVDIWIGVSNGTETTTARNFSFVNEIDWNETINVNILGHVKFNGELEDVVFPIEIQNQSSFGICIYPAFLEIETDIYLSYRESIEEYSIRDFYEFDTMLTNQTINETIYLMPFDEAFRFTLTFMTGLRSLPEKYVRILRYRPEQDGFTFIGEKTTDSDGKISDWLLLDEKYRFTVLNEDRSLFGTSATYTASCPAPPCLDTIYVGEEQEEWYIYKSPYTTGVIYKLYFNRTTNVVHYEYEDIIGEAQYGRLIVERTTVRPDENRTICDINITGMIGHLQCDLSNFRDVEFIATSYVGREPEELVASLRDSMKKLIQDIIGFNDGLFIGLLFVIVLGLIGSINPPAGIIMAIGGFAIGYGLGLYTISISSIIAVVIIGVVLVMKMRGSPYD